MAKSLKDQYSKKELERYTITKFISNEKLKLRALSLDDSETPDFIMKTMDKKISIELTSLMNPQLKARESLNDSIVARAWELFDSKYEEKLNVWVTFYNWKPNCSKTDIPIYANELFQLVENIYLNNRNYKFNINSKDNFSPADYIQSLFISNDFSFSNWQTFGAYLVEYVDFSLLLNTIKSKESNLFKYENDFDENWLVIAANFGTKSSALRFDYINKIEYKSKFDRVFIYKQFEDKIIEYV